MKTLPLLRRSVQFHEEMTIPVPWGHIAGKWWGSRDKRPILLLHGYQDNAGSFDRLVPLLKPNLSYLAIDFPGHGLSSHLPIGASYNWTDFVSYIRRIVMYFNWPKVTIMAHSLAASTAYNYATFFVDSVDALIALDSLKPVTNNQKLTDMGSKINELIKYDNLLALGDDRPTYTHEEMGRKFHEVSHKSISLEMSKYLLPRSIKRSSKNHNEFYFTGDIRLRPFPLFDFKHHQIMEMIDRFTCPTLLCKATQKIKRYAPLTETPEFYEAVKKVNKNFEMHHVEGNHHVHLNNPELVAGLINDFIDKYNL